VLYINTVYINIYISCSYYDFACRLFVIEMEYNYSKLFYFNEYKAPSNHCIEDTLEFFSVYSIVIFIFIAKLITFIFLLRLFSTAIKKNKSFLLSYYLKNKEGQELKEAEILDKKEAEILDKKEAEILDKKEAEILDKKEAEILDKKEAKILYESGIELLIRVLEKEEKNPSYTDNNPRGSLF
jgi:hypothetical protein